MLNIYLKCSVTGKNKSCAIAKYLTRILVFMVYCTVQRSWCWSDTVKNNLSLNHAKMFETIILFSTVENKSSVIKEINNCIFNKPLYYWLNTKWFKIVHRFMSKSKLQCTNSFPFVTIMIWNMGFDNGLGCII